MSQTTLDDDDLFDEAANEMRADVEEALAEAREALPDSESIWDVDADNALGVLNGLRTALDTDDAADHLRDAKKWYTMGERADAFEDAEDLRTEIDVLEELFETIATAREEASDLAATLPELRGNLDDAHENAGGADPDADGDDAEAEAEAE
jgi:hypothetical protein